MFLLTEARDTDLFTNKRFFVSFNNIYICIACLVEYPMFLELTIVNIFQMNATCGQI